MKPINGKHHLKGIEFGFSSPNEAEPILPVSTSQRKRFRDLTIPCLISQIVFLGKRGSSYFSSQTFLLWINLLSANHGSQPGCVNLLQLLPFP